MQQFDPKTYPKVVLAPYKDGGDPDMFERYLLELDDASRSDIEARLGAVSQWWANNVNKYAHYKALITRMRNEHSTAKVRLLDDAARAQLAAEVGEARRAVLATHYAKLDRALEQLHDEYGGIPSDRLETLVKIGTAERLTADVVQRHIDTAIAERGWRLLEQSSVARAEPLDAATARRIRSHIQRWEGVRRQELGDERQIRHLFDAVDVEFDASEDQLVKATRTLDQTQRHVKSGSEQLGALKNVVRDAKDYLTAGSEMVERYRATVIEDVKKLLENDFRVAAINHVIDPGEYEQLHREGMRLGLPDRLAREAIDALVDEAAETIRVNVGGEVPAYLSCPSCHAAAPDDESQTHCRACGEPLFRECPSCHKPSPRSEAVCRHCSTPFAPIERAERLLARARERLSSGYPREALEHAREITASGYAVAEADGISREAASAVTAGERELKTAATLERGPRRLYEARALLRGLARTAADVPGPDNELPAEMLGRVEGKIATAERELDEVRGTADAAARERLLVGVLEIASDCAEAQSELARIAPAPPTGLQVELAGSEVRIRWSPSPSPGELEYFVRRAEGFSPATVRDGEAVARVPETYARDPRTPAGVRVGYSVFVVRAETASAPASAGPVALAPDPANVQTSVGSGEVRLSWRLPSAHAHVTVERVEAASGATKTFSAGGDGLVDREVRNGSLYRYRVRAVYPSLEQASAGVEVSATPAEPPKPVAIASLTRVAAGLELRWQTPTGSSVVVCRSSEPLEVRSGDELPRQQLSRLGALLPGDGDQAVDPNPAGGACYTPFTVAGDRAVAGEHIRWEEIESIGDVRAEDVGSVARLTWTWPADVHHAVVSWRADAQPSGPADPAAERRHVRRDRHQEVGGGGFRIDWDGATALHVAVFSARMRDGDLRVAPGLKPSSCAQVKRVTARTTLRYDVTVKRLRRTLEVKLIGEEPYPDVVLVAKPGDSVPLRSSDGQLIAQLGGADGRPAELTLPVGKLPPARPLALRAFLAADSARDRWQLDEPSDLTALVIH